MITTHDNYKILEENEIQFPSIEILYQLQLLLFDLSGETEQTQNLLVQLSSFMQTAITATVGSVTFITVYDNYITPEDFAGFALVEWLPLEDAEDVTDSFIPVLVGQRSDDYNPENTEIKDIITNHIETLAESRFSMKEFEL